MDKRLELDEEQKKIIEKYNEIVREMDKAKIGVLISLDDCFCGVLNLKEVKGVNFADFPEEDEEIVHIEELTRMEMPSFFDLMDEYKFAIKFK